MKIKITGDGEPCGTRVFHDADDTDISAYCTGLTFTHKAGELPQADVTLALIPIEVAGVTARMIGPNGKEVRRIEYEDGTVDVFPPEQLPHVEITPMTGWTRKFRV